MGQAIGGSLPLAIGVALSPIPIIAVVLMLTSGRARANGPAFVLGWVLGLAVVGGAVLLLADPAGAGTSQSPATWTSWLRIVLGVVLLLLAVRQFRGRPRAGQEPTMPGWMARVDRATPLYSLGLAAVLSGFNPKNLLLAVGGAAVIAQADIPAGQQAAALAVFVLIGTIGVGTPVVLYLIMGERSRRLLAGLQTWMAEHNSVILSVLFLIIGAKLIGDGISGLS
jgi:threonine/homoserine/homoserine lactone efflux protein